MIPESQDVATYDDGRSAKAAAPMDLGPQPYRFGDHPWAHRSAGVPVARRVNVVYAGCCGESEVTSPEESAAIADSVGLPGRPRGRRRSAVVCSAVRCGGVRPKAPHGPVSSRSEGDRTEQGTSDRSDTERSRRHIERAIRATSAADVGAVKRRSRSLPRPAQHKSASIQGHQILALKGVRAAERLGRASVDGAQVALPPPLPGSMHSTS